MENLVMKKSTDANIYKSIRFPVDINSKIIEIVDKANEGLDKNKKQTNWSEPKILDKKIFLVHLTIAPHTFT